jgi:hypothetical protein
MVGFHHQGLGFGLPEPRNVSEGRGKRDYQLTGPYEEKEEGRT